MATQDQHHHLHFPNKLSVTGSPELHILPGNVSPTSSSPLSHDSLPSSNVSSDLSSSALVNSTTTLVLCLSLIFLWFRDELMCVCVCMHVNIPESEWTHDEFGICYVWRPIGPIEPRIFGIPVNSATTGCRWFHIPWAQGWGLMARRHQVRMSRTYGRYLFLL